MTSWLPLNHLLASEAPGWTDKEGPCRTMLFLMKKGTALKSHLHGTDKSLFFWKKFSRLHFLGRWLRESIQVAL